MIAVHLVLYLTSLGHSAAPAATLLGLLSVTGRVISTVWTRWLPMATIAAVIFSCQAVAMFLLPVIGRHVTGAIACLVVFGRFRDRIGREARDPVASRPASFSFSTPGCLPCTASLVADLPGEHLDDVRRITRDTAQCVGRERPLELDPEEGYARVGE